MRLDLSTEIFRPLGLAILTDFLDFTSGRESTFFDGGESGVNHVDMSIPYCPALNKQLLALAPSYDLQLRPRRSTSAPMDHVSNHLLKSGCMRNWAGMWSV